MLQSIRKLTDTFRRITYYLQVWKKVLTEKLTARKCLEPFDYKKCNSNFTY